MSTATVSVTKRQRLLRKAVRLAAKLDGILQEVGNAADRGTVFIMNRPEGWTPSDPHELPPGVTRHDCGSSLGAAIYASHFNRLEMKDPTGRWAFIVDRMPVEERDASKPCACAADAS